MIADDSIVQAWESIVYGVLSGLLTFVILELVRIFSPPWLYDRIVKFERKIRFRNKAYPVSITKSFETTSLEPNLSSIKKLIKSTLERVFCNFSLEFVDSKNEYDISANIRRSGVDIRIIIEIELPDSYSEEIRIIVIQKTNVKFKSIERVLNYLFWNLVDLEKAFSKELIVPSSENVKVEFQSDDVKVFFEIFDKFKLDYIVGSNVSVKKRDKYAVVSIEDKIGPELAKRIRELIVLGHL